jgi:hypothetical protein
MEGDEQEPDFQPGEMVESVTGFFLGKGEVVRNLHTRYGWFVVVAHEGGPGEVQTACTARNLKRSKTNV